MSGFKIQFENREEQDAMQAQIARRDPGDIRPVEAALSADMDLKNFTLWDQRLSDRNGYDIGFNHFMSENAKQWGRRAGVNSGNGQFEGRMGLGLFLALGERFKTPDWWKDDNTFYKFLREHPELDGRPGKNDPRGEKIRPGGIDAMLA